MKKFSIADWQKKMDKIVIDRDYFEELIRKDVIFRFVRDIGTQDDGNVYIPGHYFEAAKATVDECVEKIIAEQLDHAARIAPDTYELEKGFRV